MPAANKGGSPREGDETYLEAHERYGQMRAEEGLPTDAGGTRIVTRYDDVSFALKNVDSFGGTLGYNPELPDDVQILPSIPEPRHGKVRRVISGVIAPHRLAPGRAIRGCAVRTAAVKNNRSRTSRSRAQPR